MAHITVHYCVRGTVESSDSSFLDNVESALPDSDDTYVGSEFTMNRQPVLDDNGEETGRERLTARMTFATDEQLHPNTNKTAEEAARDLYDTVVGSDLAGKAEDYEVVLYRTPEGAVRSDDVQEWYEENPDQQPTDEDGEAYVPSTWDPTHHELARTDNLN